MQSLNLNRVSAICILIVLAGGFGQTTKTIISPLAYYTEHEIFLSGKTPKVGEIFEVIYRFRLKPDAPSKQGQKYYVKFSTGLHNPIEVIDTKEIVLVSLIPGEWQEIRGRFRIPKPYGDITLFAQLRGEGGKYGLAGTHFGLHLIDSLAGQYATGEVYLKSLPVEYRYDPVDGSFTCSPDQNPAPLEENRRIIIMMKQLEPALSDSEALLLHSDQYRVGCPIGLPRWDEKNKRWIEEDIFEYYLKDGWFKALREGRREEWIEREREKIR